MHRVVVLLLSTILVVCNAETIQQCTCKETEPCKNGYVNSIIPCADKCGKYVSILGGDYSKARQCLTSREEQIRRIMKCIERSYPNACTNGQRKMLQKRYPETMRIAILSQINKMFEKSGVEREVKGLLAMGQKFIGCSRTCMEKRTHECAKHANCQLDLPPDQVLINTSIKCAHQNGLTTQSIRQLCNCLADSGIQQLKGVCPKIQFM